MRRGLLLLVVVCCCASAAAQTSTPASRPGEPAVPAASTPASTATGFLFKKMEHKGQTYPYSVYVPPDYSPEKAWPVVLFLHGSGERGTDGLLQTEVGIGTAIRRHRHLCPAIVVMPQCPPAASWNGDIAEMAVRCVEQTSAEYHLDSQRVYLTGLSLGGAGAWLIGARLNGQFAAIAPLCGFYSRPNGPGDPATLAQDAKSLASVPIWTFHGAADRAVPPQRTREIVEAIRKAGGTIRFTEYPDAGHDIWNRVYGEPEFWKWLLAQRKPATPAVEKKPADAAGAANDSKAPAGGPNRTSP